MVNTSIAYTNPDQLTSRERPAIRDFPKVVTDTVALFQSMPLRNTPDDPNDIPEAITIIVIAYDGQSPAQLVTAAPAPQPGQPAEYGWFIRRLDDLYRARFP